jgi:glycosyltransferase involved in cell wall biosynthesis
VIRLPENQGVGGAVVMGFKAAMADKMDIIIKIDGDGQMNSADIPRLISPIAAGHADFSKGNRFYFPKQLAQMPVLRLAGNSVLSLVNKAVSGYWSIIDPTNGFLAIHRIALEMLPLDNLDRRYFFESDLLFRLSTIRAVVRDVPIDVRYADEKSSLKISRVLFDFPGKYLSRLLKRILYLYLIRDFNFGTISLLGSIPLLFFGLAFGALKWTHNMRLHTYTPSGTVMLAALPLILGFQLFLTFVVYDLQAEPRVPLQSLLDAK